MKDKDFNFCALPTHCTNVSRWPIIKKVKEDLKRINVQLEEAIKPI